MKSERRFEVIFIVIAFVFSWWLFFKSFSYDEKNHVFYIARNEVGDFGLHLGLIRSFSWGENYPVESPFFPGRPLPYHYYFDLAIGLLEKMGIRMDLAMNGLSALAFTVLLYLIYKLFQLIFEKNRFLAITAVLLFIFPANTSFLDFFEGKKILPSLIHEIWTLPDLISRGPFDGKLPSIYFTQVVYLNQRHLVLGLSISLGTIYIVLQKILLNDKISSIQLIVLGLILGISTRIHSLVSASALTVIVILLVMFRKFRWILPLSVSAAATTFIIYGNVLPGSNLISHNYFHPGFLTPGPFSILNFFNYWWSNLWLGIVLIPLGFLISDSKQRKIFTAFFMLFIVANVFQLSYRIEHNHSLINYFLIIANCYSAFVLLKISKYGFKGKVLSGSLILFLVVSGILNLMGVKNDFKYPVTDAPSDKLIQWVKVNTYKRAVFLNQQNLYDPIVLAGRRSYFGDTYYLQVMGYDFSQRQALAKKFYEATHVQTLNMARKEGIDYLVIPLKSINDFPYVINKKFIKDQLEIVYKDANVEIFKL